MTDPRRPDLSDEALFGDIDRAATLDRMPDVIDAPVLAATAAALRAMLSANLKPIFGWNQTDAEQVWAAALRDVSPAAIIATGGEWARDGSTFPELVEFEAAARSIDRKMQTPVTPERDWDQACDECGEAECEGWVYLSNPDDGGVQDRRPCSKCRPTQHEMYLRGHFNPNGGACRCHHPACPDTIKQKRRKAAMAG